MTSFLTRSGPDGDGAYVHTIIVTTDNDKHYKYVQEAARFCIDHMKPRTNADRIRSMTDEELYSVLEILARNDECVNSAHDDCRTCIWFPFCGSVHCAEDVLDWLKQPYKENE